MSRPQTLPASAHLADDRESVHAVVISLTEVESAFLVQTTPCAVGQRHPFTLNHTEYRILRSMLLPDNKHPDLPALSVFLQYLRQFEGPMWRKVRGLGLAYDFE